MLCCDVSNNHLAIPKCCVSPEAGKRFQETDSWLAACRHLQRGDSTIQTETITKITKILLGRAWSYD